MYLDENKDENKEQQTTFQQLDVVCCSWSR